MPVVRRAAKPFWSSLLERYWPETEDPSNELGSTVSFKAPVFSYVTDLARLFALAKGWVITKALEVRFMDRFFDNYIMTAMQKPVIEALKAEGARKDEAMAEARQALDTAYAWLEDKLSDRSWAAGDD